MHKDSLKKTSQREVTQTKEGRAIIFVCDSYTMQKDSVKQIKTKKCRATFWYEISGKQCRFGSDAASNLCLHCTLACLSQYTVGLDLSVPV